MSDLYILVFYLLPVMFIILFCIDMKYEHLAGGFIIHFTLRRQYRLLTSVEVQCSWWYCIWISINNKWHIMEVTIKSTNNWIHWTNYWNCLLLTKWVKLFNLGHIESACSWSDNSGILMVSLISWIIRCKP